MRAILILIVLFVAPRAHAEPRDLWLWAFDGRFEESKSPCANVPKRVNPARSAIYDFIGTGTPQKVAVSYVRFNSDRLDLIRDNDVLDTPAKRLVDNNGIPISMWYRGSRTWIVTIHVPEGVEPTTALASPAFVSVTLVMEANDKRVGKPICHERWIGTVSP